MHLYNQNMLRYIDYLKRSKKVKFKKEMYNVMGIDGNNVPNIRAGKINFTTNQIIKFCKHYNIDSNEILGLKELSI